MMRPRISDFHGARWFSPRRPELKVGDVQPFSTAGAGIITSHPVSLLVIAAVLLLTIECLPPARLFVLATLLLGAIVGLILWLRHR